ncbi:MAG: NnrS protein involved in response to [Labilithrix sp.]|nr:NnrS protein involved in response to [Labilithrix sp.]
MARPLPLHGFPPPATSAARVAVFAKGFRPFFLLASLSAALLLPLWLLVLAGVLQPASHFAPPFWHAHEMVFGFAVAVIAGFLLTAVGNWTQRETATGLPLVLLCGLWLLGRIAMSTALFAPGLVAIADLAFLPALMVVLARPLLAANNRRNFVMLAVLAALFATNVMTHLDALGSAPGWQRRGVLVAVDIVVVLMLVISGRVLPMFTRNATGRDGIRSIPTLDGLAVGMMAVLTALDAFTASTSSLVATLAGITAVLAAARAARWGTLHTLQQPLLWILHVGYFWIPVGLLLRAAGGTYASMATHALTAGAVGALTLGMMARVSLGHTGRQLTVGRPISAAFVLVTLAAVVRVLAPLAPQHYLTSLAIAGVLWAAAFAVFLVVYAKVLVSPRVDGRAG